MEKAGVKPLYLNPELELCPEHVLEDALDWVLKIYSDEYREILNLKNMTKPEQWERFVTWDMYKGHHITRLYREAQKNLRSAFQRPKPQAFKKAFIDRIIEREKNAE